MSLAPGQVVTSTATNSGNTGEFGVNVAVPGGNPVVTFTNSMIGTFAYRCIDVSGASQANGAQLIDVLRLNLHLGRQLVGIRHDQHQRLARGDHAPDCMDGELVHGSRLG